MDDSLNFGIRLRDSYKDESMVTPSLYLKEDINHCQILGQF